MGVRQLSFDIMGLEKKTVCIVLNHIIFGKQELSISCFEPFTTKDEIGFVANGHKVYMKNEEIQRIECNKNLIKIVGNLQTMEIKIQ